MTEKIQHPGAYVRAHVIPSDMNVTSAAKLLDVSRPTLSNFLNGNADLSSEMAARLERAFGKPARQLLDMQTAWDAAHAARSSIIPAIKSYVPPFLQIKARRIEEWSGSGITTRQRLSVFLRTLVNSTGLNLRAVNFPGNDHSERAGWDGLIETDEGTPWIPQGRSGWEFGVNQDPKAKADGDYETRVGEVEAKERKDMTFVFVTPRAWPGKDAWVKQRRAEKRWKDVRTYDASDLEQWLEQSIAGQVWFANETGQVAEGAISLDEAWKNWAADCEPELRPSLFADAVAAYAPTLKRAVEGDGYKPIVISADSHDEALAFLSSGFSENDLELGPFRDRVVVFREPGALSKLAAQVSNFIPVIMTREVEKEFAPFRAAMPSFIIYPRNATASDPDIVLETLNHEAFAKALTEMGLEHERIDQLGRETGRSPTVLRRRLSKLAAIQTPDWASDKTVAQMLVPFLFAGTWRADNKADQAMLEVLAGDVQFEELERRIVQLLPLDSAPVWSAGSFRGVVSKIDMLFAIRDVVVSTDLQRFFEVAALVLGEVDPALDLPEDKRWAANIYNKTREISGALRDGLAETLVLLAVYGSNLFKARLNFDAPLHADRMVRSLLQPLTAITLESQSSDLPLYSEAAPETFLSIIEEDLRQPEPETLNIMRPLADTLFSRAPRTGLIWALENLAWSERHFMRTVLVLGRLSEKVIDDNLVNKPRGSLSSIFRSWMPQTSAGLEARKLALTKLAEKHPTVAWPICIEQFEPHGSRIGHYGHKPRWRPDGHGYGNPVSLGEGNDFALHAFKLALEWPVHTRDTIGDLVGSLEGIDESMKSEVWNVVERWVETASEEDRAWLREKIRVSAFSRRAVKRRKGRAKDGSDQRAQDLFAKLEPADPVLRHEWLFRKSWVDESAGEMLDEDFDFRKREERIAQQRLNAVREILEGGGIDAVMRLAKTGEAQHNIGWSLSKAVGDIDALKAALRAVVDAGPLTGTRFSLVKGALVEAENRDADVLGPLVAELDADGAMFVLLAAPFNRRTWGLVESLGPDAAARYWWEIEPGWNRTPDEVAYGVKRLMEAGRPRAAFQFARFEMKELPPRDIFNLLNAIAKESREAPKTYMLSSYELKQAFEILNASGEMSIDEMAGLEFIFIDVFDDDEEEGGLVNLPRQIERHPELFVQAVTFAYTRDDEAEDPPELQAATEEQRSSRAMACYRLLGKLSIVPGHDMDGNLDAGLLVNWIEQVRAQCASLSRSTMCDQSIGQLLSHAPAADDGVWPCLPVRDALEQVMSEHIGRGLHVALRNARGAHWRGEGGAQERVIAAKYGGWAKAMEYTHPRVAAILHELEESYLREAEYEDNDAKITRRMRR